MTTQHLTGSYIQSSWARKRKERHTHLNRKLSLFSKDLILYTFPWYKLGKKFILSGKKKLACNVGEAGLIPGSGRSTGEVNGNPLQYSCLGNLMDRGVWQAIAHGVAKELDMTYWLNNNNLLYTEKPFESTKKPLSANKQVQQCETNTAKSAYFYTLTMNNLQMILKKQLLINCINKNKITSVQLLSCVWLFVTPWTAACQASLSITNSQRLLKLTSIESVIPSNHLILCHTLLLLPSIFPSIRVFSSESVLHIRWPKYWSISFSISPSNEYSGLISFRTDWIDLLAVQGTLKSLLQHHSSKTSVLQRSVFFTVQLSHPYLTTRKTIALNRWIFVGKVMSLLFNMLSRLVITFLPRSKHLLISWLQSASAVILEPKKIVCHCLHCFPIYLPWSDGTGCHGLHYLNVEF